MNKNIFDFGANFPEIISNNLINDFKSNDFSKALIIFPHKRPKFFIEKILSKKLKMVFYSPVYFDMDLFVCYLSGVESFSNNLDLLALILNIFEKQKGLKKICEKPPVALDWASSFLDSFEKVQMELVEYDKLKNCSHPDENIFFNFFPQIYNEFLIELNKNKLITRGMAYNFAARSGNFEKLKNFEKIYFVVPPGLTKSEKEILNKIRDFDNLGLYLEGFDIDTSDGFKIIHNETKKDANFDIVPCSSSHSQMIKLREKLEKIKDLESIAIVLPRSRELLPILENVLSYFPQKEFNISLGYPLIYSPFYKFIENIFSLQINKTDEKYSSNLIIDFLSNPIIYNLAKEISEYIKTIRKLKENFINENVYYISKEDLIKNIEEISNSTEILNFIKEIIKNFILPFENPLNLKDLCENLFNILNLISEIKILDKNPFSYEYLEAIYKFLYDLEGSNFCSLKFKRDDLFEIFLSFLKQLKINFTGHPLKGWQVLGFLEVRTLSFENVFILNLNEGVLPSIETFDPIIPLSVKETLGLPGPKEEEEIYKHHFLHLIYSCKNCTLFYLDNEEEDVRSRFLEQIIWEKEKKEEKILKFDLGKEFNLVLKYKEQLKIEKSDEIIDYLKKKEFSASSIDNYLMCPLKFYFQNILNLKESIELEEEADAMTYGTIIHIILERLQKEYIGKEIKNKQLEEMKNNLEKTIDAIFKEMGFKENLQNKILKKLISLRIVKFLQDTDAIPIPFKIKEIEKLIKSVDFYEIKLHGKIDRIDETKDGLRVIDYKTGSVKKFIEKEKIADPSSFDDFQKAVGSFQMPIYLYFIKKLYDKDYDKIDAIFYPLRGNFDKKSKDDVEKARNFGEVYLKKFLGIIFDKSIPFEAKPKNKRICLYCSYRNLCKYA